MVAINYGENQLIFAIFLFFIVAVLVWAISLLKIKWYEYKYSKTITGPKPLELISCVLQIFKKPKNYLNIAMPLFSKYSPTSVIWYGWDMYFVISDPEDLKLFMNSSETQEKHYLYSFANVWADNGLLSAPVPLWRKTRKCLSLFFSNKNINTFAQDTCKHGSEWTETQLIKAIDKDSVNIHDYVKIYTLSVILDLTLNARADPKMLTYIDTLSNGIIDMIIERACKFYLHPDCLYNLSSKSKKIRQMVDSFVDCFEKLAADAETRTKPDDDWIENATSKTYLAFLNELSEKNEVFSRHQIRSEMLTLTVAGYDTLTHALSFVLLMLGMYQDVQQKLYDEIIEILGPDRDLQPNDLPRFAYLDRVIKETMRLFPPGPVQVHTVSSDIELKTCTIPSGSTVMNTTFNLHRNEKYWPDPLRFDPNRFSPKEVEMRHPYCFMPFMAGPRNCIGHKFAMMSMKSLLPTVVRKFKFSAENKPIEDIEVAAHFILYSVNGYQMSVELRK